jgi:hypothetical protein
MKVEFGNAWAMITVEAPCPHPHVGDRGVTLELVHDAVRRR